MTSSDNLADQILKQINRTKPLFNTLLYCLFFISIFIAASLTNSKLTGTYYAIIALIGFVTGVGCFLAMRTMHKNLKSQVIRVLTSWSLNQEKTNNDLSKQNESIKQEAEEMRIKLADSLNKIKTTKQNVEMLNRKLSLLQETGKENDSDLIQLKNSIAELQNKNREYQDEIRVLTEEKETTLGELISLKSTERNTREKYNDTLKLLSAVQHELDQEKIVNLSLKNQCEKLESHTEHLKNEKLNYKELYEVEKLNSSSNKSESIKWQTKYQETLNDLNLAKNDDTKDIEILKLKTDVRALTDSLEQKEQLLDALRTKTKIIEKKLEETELFKSQYEKELSSQEGLVNSLFAQLRDQSRESKLNLGNFFSWTYNSFSDRKIILNFENRACDLGVVSVDTEPSSDCTYSGNRNLKKNTMGRIIISDEKKDLPEDIKLCISFTPAPDKAHFKITRNMDQKIKKIEDNE